jgi:hypothetical protein
MAALAATHAVVENLIREKMIAGSNPPGMDTVYSTTWKEMNYTKRVAGLA